MTINHHASDELLLAYAAGQLSSAPALLVASHVAMSGQSAERLCGFEQLGGALLDEQPLADVAPDLFDKMLARLGEPEPAGPIRVPHDHSHLAMGIDLPAPLAERKIGKWRTIGPGMRYARVDVSEDPGYNVVLLRVAAGRALPQHGHSGTELTLILKGSFSDEGGTYRAGDFEEEEGSAAHQPMVSPDGECICVTAIEGSLKPSGWIARMMMPMFGF